MAESIVQVSEGSGKKLHTNSYTVGANTVEDEFVVPGEFPYASYVAATGVSTTAANAGDDMFQIMAGASLKLRIRRIRVEQAVVITTAAIAAFSINRLSSAGTGGTAITPAKMNTADAASGATAASGVPTATKGAASVYLFSRSFWPVQTAPAGGMSLPYFEWVQQPGMEPITIPAGTTNGLCIRNLFARAGLFVHVEIEFVETAF